MWCTRREGRLIVLAHGDRAPLDTEFDHMLSEVDAAGAAGAPRLLTLAAGHGGPNAAQRRQLSAVEPFTAGELRVVILTESHAVRAILTAMSWMSEGKTPAYPPSRIADAVEALGLAADELTTVDRLMAEVCEIGGYTAPPLVAGD